jgi:hypothetical protein
VANELGRAHALTVFSPIRPGWTPFLRLVLRIGQWNGRRSKENKPGKLQRLSFIHYARWAIISRMPYVGPSQKPDKLNYKYLFFESNFNGSFGQYIDAFSYVIPDRMTLIWGSSFGFPRPIPEERFERYIKHNEFVANHFYSAYPDATATMIGSAFRLERRHAEFAAQVSRDRPDAREFAGAWRDFLYAVQGDL